jgi:hypothetical protein
VFESFCSKSPQLQCPAAPGLGPDPGRAARGLGGAVTPRRKESHGQLLLLPHTSSKKDKLEPEEAAEYVGARNIRALRRLMKFEGLPYVRLSPRKIQFIRADLDAWLEQRKRK